MSTTSHSVAPSVTYIKDISCEFKIRFEISGEKLFSDKKFFSTHSADSGEKCSFTALAVEIKSPLKFFFTAIYA